jgi:hypothetical protein
MGLPRPKEGEVLQRCYEQDWRMRDWDSHLSTFHFPLFIPVLQQLVRGWAHARLGFFHFPFSISHFFLMVRDWDAPQSRSGTPCTFLQRMLENGKMENPNLAAARLGFSV